MSIEKKEEDKRKNKFQRKLTQQNLDRGDDRNFAIKHAEISIELNNSKFVSDKDLKRIIKESLEEALRNLTEKKDTLNIDIYNQENTMSVRYKYKDSDSE